MFWSGIPLSAKSRPAAASCIRLQVNIPLQLNFSALAVSEKYVQVDKGTPMLQYVPAILPDLEIVVCAADG